MIIFDFIVSHSKKLTCTLKAMQVEQINLTPACDQSQIEEKTYSSRQSKISPYYIKGLWPPAFSSCKPASHTLHSTLLRPPQHIANLHSAFYNLERYIDSTISAHCKLTSYVLQSALSQNTLLQPIRHSNMLNPHHIGYVFDPSQNYRMIEVCALCRIPSLMFSMLTPGRHRSLPSTSVLW